MYGAEGVCRIADISVQNMHGEEVEYYVLKPVNGGNSTIFVPTGNETLTARMKRVMSEDEICDLIKTMSGEDEDWIDNDNMRKQHYRDIIAEGNRAELVKMIKAIYLHGQERNKIGKKLHLSDEKFLKDAEKLLYDEFSHVLKIKREDVIPYIMEHISNQ